MEENLETVEEVGVKMLHFEKQYEKTKKGKIVKRLKAVHVQASISWVMDFIEKMKPTIHHWNQLKNVWTNINILLNSITNVAEIGLDVSENINIPVNKEPQSFHWGGFKVENTVYSVLSKSEGNRTYHPYISDDLTHKQAFVKVVGMGMLEQSINQSSFISP